MTHHRRPNASAWLFALVMGVAVMAACTRVRETPQEQKAIVKTAGDAGASLELQVVGDPVVVTAGESFVVPVRLRNVGTTPVGLIFMSSCSFRLTIATAAGRELARPESFCLSVIREPTLEPGGVLEDTLAYTLGEPGVVRLAPGSYRVTPVLLSVSDVSLAIRSSRLEVRPPADTGGHPAVDP